jgi:hypothetical protein
VTSRTTTGRSLRWVVVAIILFVLFCIWFCFTGLWEDLQYD